MARPTWGRSNATTAGLRTIGAAVAVAALGWSAGCDALPVDPPGTAGDLGLRLALVAPAADSTILAKVDRLALRLVRPDGSERDTVLTLQRIGGATRARLRLSPRESVPGLEIHAILKASWREYYRGSVALGPTELEGGPVTLEMIPIVSRIVIAPSPVAFVGLADTARLLAVGYFPEGEAIPAFRPSWSSSSPEVVTVSPDGLASGRANGKAVVEARYGQVVATVVVRVVQVATQVRQLVPDKVTLRPGESLQLDIVGVDARGQPLGKGAVATWEAQPPGSGVLSVNSAGLLLARSAGVAWITARGTAGGSAAAAVEVTPLPVSAPPVILLTGFSAVMSSDLAGTQGQFAPFARATQVTRSPDGKWAAWVRDGNLYIDQVGDQVRHYDGPKTVSWPEFSADGGWIYFSNVGTGGVDEVYRVRPNGLGIQLVVRYAVMPTPSPDGTRLAFVRGRDLMVHEIGGDSKVLLKDADPATPVWSPDGDWIACVAGGPSRVAFVRPDGTAFHFLDGRGFRPGISWSPDGKWLLGFASGAALISPETLEIIHLGWAYAGDVAWWR